MQKLEDRLKLTVGYTSTLERSRPLFQNSRVTIPKHVRDYVHKAQKKLPARKKANYETPEFNSLVKAFSEDVHKEFMREYNETIKFLDKQNAFQELYAYAKEEHPDIYEKSKQDDLDKISKYFEGWEVNVQPERMEEVINYYSEKAGNIGGQRALDELGIKMVFNLKNPDIIKEIQNRGHKITGGISDKTLNDFKNTMYRGYMEKGMSPYDLKKRIKGMFEETYENRAFTIARTESGIAQMTVQNESYLRNGVTKKEWNAIVDEQTRDSHVDLDGEVALIGEPFSNGMMYPLDGNGPPDEVINCRCDYTAYEVEGHACTGDTDDGNDCNIPWQGGEDIDATPDLDSKMQEVYAKPIDEGGMGFMEMMKMSPKELDMLTTYLDQGKMNKAYSLIGKHSGRKTSTIKGMSKSNASRAKSAYKNCIG